VEEGSIFLLDEQDMTLWLLLGTKL